MGIGDLLSSAGGKIKKLNDSIVEMRTRIDEMDKGIDRAFSSIEKHARDQHLDTMKTREQLSHIRSQLASVCTDVDNIKQSQRSRDLASELTAHIDKERDE